ncbi:MAG: HAD-IA family hydrolase [Acidimicrobiia bacterium]|nr:HAD-IA family hydrolase [Acidimicrobiia bacterium]
MTSVVFDLDGTLLDSDEALVRPFVELGVPRSQITFGHVLEAECHRLGISVADYLERYDPERAEPFPGVEDILRSLDRWAVCSNKHPRSGWAELDRLGWQPDVARFSDAFEGSKRLGPVLDALGVVAADVVYVGDTDHDRRCARDVGATFVLAAWNDRAEPGPGDIVAARPGDVLEVVATLDGGRGTQESGRR